MRVWNGFVWIRLSLVAGSCEHGNEPQDFIKDGKFLDHLSDLSASREILCSVELVIDYNIRDLAKNSIYNRQFG
jgi:hypothetical protein